MINNDGKFIQLRVENTLTKVPYCDYFEVEEEWIMLSTD
jgi:hypothetical protein